MLAGFAVLLGAMPVFGQKAEKVPAPLVVTLDTVALKELGVLEGPVLDQAIQAGMQAAGANYVIKRAIVLASKSDADITPQVIALMNRQTPSATPKAFAPLLVLVDMAAVKKLSGKDSDTVTAAITAWMKKDEDESNLVLDRPALRTSTTEMEDITLDILNPLRGMHASGESEPKDPRILLLSELALMQKSKAGQDIARQEQALVEPIKAELMGRAEVLRKRGEELQAILSKLPNDEKRTRVEAFRAQELALRKEAEAKDQEIRNADRQARNAIEIALMPILPQIMRARGANFVLDADAFAAAPPDSDVTDVVAEKLDAKLIAVPVKLESHP